MRCFCWLSFLLILSSAAVAWADDPPRRTSRVAASAARSVPMEEPKTTAPALKPAVPPPATSPALGRPTLLEPSFQMEGVGRGVLTCFQVQVARAEVWQLVVQEIDGPVAQIFEGQGPPPSRIPWDGRLLDGGLAWSGMTYGYYLAYVDSSGSVGEVAGSDFTLPAYSREDRDGLSFLMSGSRLSPGRRGDPVAAASAGLQSVVEQLNQIGGTTPVRIEVLGRDETSALALGESIRAALTAVLDPGDRAVELYVGAAAAAPVEGTVLITTAPLPTPAS